MTVRNDPLDAHFDGLDECLDDFLGQLLREVIEDVLHALNIVSVSRVKFERSEIARDCVIMPSSLDHQLTIHSVAQ